jgi:hypothetical protein
VGVRRDPGSVQEPRRIAGRRALVFIERRSPRSRRRRAATELVIGGNRDGVG